MAKYDQSIHSTLLTQSTTTTNHTQHTLRRCVLDYCSVVPQYHTLMSDLREYVSKQHNQPVVELDLQILIANMLYPADGGESGVMTGVYRVRWLR